jgi:hypothetical protein
MKSEVDIMGPLGVYPSPKTIYNVRAERMDGT